MNDIQKKHLKYLTHWCSRAEKSLYDIRQYLIKHSMPGDLHQDIFDYLIEHDYVNEQRYAAAFVHDAFKFNHWGRQKIRQALLQKKINSELVSQAIDSQIDADEYEAVLKDLLSRKKQSLKNEENKVQKQKSINFALSRGFELEIILKVLES